MREFIAGENDQDVRLSRFVLRVTHNLPNSVLYKSFRNKRVKVNGAKATPDQRLSLGDVIQLYLNDEFFPTNHPSATHIGKPSCSNLPLQFSHNTVTPKKPITTEYEDPALAILFKPQGMLSHSDATKDTTLLDAFTGYLIEKNEYNPDTSNGFAPALCNRLDRGTEGLVIGAKRYDALRDMNEIIRLGHLEKYYLCITTTPPPEGVHNAFLLRDRGNKTVSISQAMVPGAKAISTGVKVIQASASLCLCEIQLITGRTHQIRAHLNFLGAPILGDKKYGNPAINKTHSLKTQALSAYRLTFGQSLPQNSTLGYLAGKNFTTTQGIVSNWWNHWVNRTSRE